MKVKGSSGDFEKSTFLSLSLRLFAEFMAVDYKTEMLRLRKVSIGSSLLCTIFKVCN